MITLSRFVRRLERLYETRIASALAAGLSENAAHIAAFAHVKKIGGYALAELRRLGRKPLAELSGSEVQHVSGSGTVESVRVGLVTTRTALLNATKRLAPDNPQRLSLDEATDDFPTSSRGLVVGEIEAAAEHATHAARGLNGTLAGPGGGNG